MIMSAGLRKVALTAHVTSSIGWFGAVAAFLALAIAGLTSQDAQLVRAAYLAMELTTWFVIVPLAFVSGLTGVVSSLGTKWGLFRYYWVLMKLVITILATIVLLIHTQPIDLLASVAAKTTTHRIAIILARRMDMRAPPRADNGSALNGRPGARPSFESQGPFRPAGPFQCRVIRQPRRRQVQIPPDAS